MLNLFKNVDNPDIQHCFTHTCVESSADALALHAEDCLLYNRSFSPLLIIYRYNTLLKYLEVNKTLKFELGFYAEDGVQTLNVLQQRMIEDCTPLDLICVVFTGKLTLDKLPVASRRELICVRVYSHKTKKEVKRIAVVKRGSNLKIKQFIRFDFNG